MAVWRLRSLTGESGDRKSHSLHPGVPWHTFVIPAVGTMRQKDRGQSQDGTGELKASMSYITTPCLDK